MDWTVLVGLAAGTGIPLAWFIHWDVSKVARQQERAADALQEIAATLKRIEVRMTRD